MASRIIQVCGISGVYSVVKLLICRRVIEELSASESEVTEEMSENESEEIQIYTECFGDGERELVDQRCQQGDLVVQIDEHVAKYVY